MTRSIWIRRSLPEVGWKVVEEWQENIVDGRFDNPKQDLPEEVYDAIIDLVGAGYYACSFQCHNHCISYSFQPTVHVGVP